MWIRGSSRVGIDLLVCMTEICQGNSHRPCQIDSPACRGGILKCRANATQPTVTLAKWPRLSSPDIDACQGVNIMAIGPNSVWGDTHLYLGEQRPPRKFLRVACQ